MPEVKQLDLSANDYLQPFEPAARIYCQKTGMDPDLQLPRPHPTIAGLLEAWPQWRLIAEQLLDLSLMLTSMREASAKPLIQQPGAH